MTTEDFIIHLFCYVDDHMIDQKKHSQAHLWPSELVTIGLLFALKGGYFRAFYRWLKRDYEKLFVHLPERTRLLRLLKTHQGLTAQFLADPTLFTVVDSYGVELIHPVREGRSQQQFGQKGYSNRRWIVGIKLCWLLNGQGRVVGWDWNTANVHDQKFLPLVERFEGQTITLSDLGFRCKQGIPENLKLCPRGTWSERIIIETAFSMVTRVCQLKRIYHRAKEYMQMRFAFVSALFNVLLSINQIVFQSNTFQIAQFSL